MQGLGIYGASRQSWIGSEMRKTLQLVVLNNPNATTEDIKRITREILRREVSEEHIADETWDYWASNAIHNLASTIDRQNKATPSKTAQQARAEGKKAIQEQAEKLAPIMKTNIRRLGMELLMPNGKVFGDCTRGDFRQLGAGFAAMVKRLPNEVAKARDVVTEEEAWKVVNSK